MKFSDLFLNDKYFLQFTISLVDGGGLRSVSPLTCEFTVIRNNHAPVFTNLPHVAEVLSNIAPSSRIFDVDATDADPPVSVMSIKDNIFSY